MGYYYSIILFLIIYILDNYYTNIIVKASILLILKVWLLLEICKILFNSFKLKLVN